jgi:hypothetical protein
MSRAITPFSIHIDDSVIADLHRRLGNTRWPERETVDDGCHVGYDSYPLTGRSLALLIDRNAPRSTLVTS